METLARFLRCAAHLPIQEPTSGPRLAAGLGWELGVERLARADWMLESTDEGRMVLRLREGLAPRELNFAAFEGLAAYYGQGCFDAAELALTLAMPYEVLVPFTARLQPVAVADYFRVPVRVARERLRQLGWLRPMQRAEPESGYRLRVGVWAPEARVTGS